MINNTPIEFRLHLLYGGLARGSREFLISCHTHGHHSRCEIHTRVRKKPFIASRTKFDLMPEESRDFHSRYFARSLARFLRGFSHFLVYVKGKRSKKKKRKGNERRRGCHTRQTGRPGEPVAYCAPYRLPFNALQHFQPPVPRTRHSADFRYA